MHLFLWSKEESETQFQYLESLYIRWLKEERIRNAAALFTGTMLRKRLYTLPPGYTLNRFKSL
jgi:hypothetical protein